MLECWDAGLLVGGYHWMLMGCFLGKGMKGSLWSCLEEDILIFFLCFLTQLHAVEMYKTCRCQRCVNIWVAEGILPCICFTKPRFLPVLIHDLHLLYGLRQGCLGKSLPFLCIVTFDQMVCSASRLHFSKIQEWLALLIHW